MSQSESNSNPTGANDEHAAAWRLLPWLANGTLAEPELSQVLDHLKTCGVCRDELRFLPELRFLVEQAELEAPTTEAPAEATWNRLMERIEHHEAEALPSSPSAAPVQASRTDPSAWVPSVVRQRVVEPRVRWWRRRAAARVGTWGFPVVAAQALLLVLVLGLVWTGGRASVVDSFASGVPGGAEFETLTQEPVAKTPTELGPRARLIFTEGVEERQMRQLLLELDATIVDGPNRVGAYTVALPELDAGLVDELRQRAVVAFVEPVAGVVR